MKFAKELEQDLVPEWRAKYFDYKTGKKKVKAVARALKTVNQTPKTPGRQLPSNLLANALQSPIRNHASHHDSSVQNSPDYRVSNLTSYGSVKDTLPGEPASSQFGIKSTDGQGSPEGQPASAPVTIPRQSAHETINESETLWDSGAMTNYGSIVFSPPTRNPRMGPPSLELPDPALSPNEENFPRHNRAWRASRFNPFPHTTPPSQRIDAKPGNAYEVGKPTNPPKLDSSHLLPKSRNLFKPRRTASTPDRGLASSRPSRLRRIFSTAGLESPQVNDVPMEAYKEYDLRNAQYFTFLDNELEKIEAFYKMKEAQAGKRLQVLRQQLHEMRDRRLEEIRTEQLAKERAERDQERRASGQPVSQANRKNGELNKSISTALKWMQPIENAVRIGPSRIGKVTKSLQQYGSPSGPEAHNPPTSNRPDSWRDFARRPTHPDEVPYRAAKRKLKLALQEFYRGLELLKSYALLNRTAFRKINKKYDKAIKARPTGRYMSEKVNKAWFVQSEVLEGQIVAVEDLYARYFERGNHKVAVGKLRSKSAKAGDFSGSVFRNGLLLAGGLVFGIEGIVYGAKHLVDPNPAVNTDASYLLQIWTMAKINYPFIFEFDSRHDLDWHQLAELPCFLFFMLGLFMWLNFQQSGADAMFLYWPVLLVGITVLILFFPAPILYHRSRLLNPYAEHPFLREVLGYKRPWVYYLAMILDPILRFNWVFYAIYSSELQHSALLSFFVGFSEVCRRGMWTLFRVENEHCTNVGRFRASRDVPLPYEIEPPSPSSPEENAEIEPSTRPSPDISRYSASPRHAATSSTLEAQPSQGSLRRRSTAAVAVADTPISRGIVRVGTIMGQAHAQDFERKRRPSAPVSTSPYSNAQIADGESSDEEDEEEEQDQNDEDGQQARNDLADMQDVEDVLRRHRSAIAQ
ncbi:xenotropic and polytropic retrovirus receptor 1, partial [Lecanoromycetidae sp. Uapishka_2]